LLLYLYRIVYSLIDGGNAVRIAVTTLANHRNYLFSCYGIAARVQALAHNWVTISGSDSRFRCGGVTQAELRVAAGLMFTEDAIRRNVLNGPSGGVNIDTYGMAGDTSAADIANIYAAGGQAQVTASLQQAVLMLQNAAAPLQAAALALPLDALFPTNGASSVFTLRGSIQYMTSLYEVVPIGLGRDGSCSPTVVLEQSGNGFSLSTLSMCLTVQDAIVGAVIGNDHVIWCTFAGMCYSFHNVNQSVRVHTTPISMSYDAFRVRVFMDGVKSGSY